MFDLGLDSKLRVCDLLKMRVRDICHGEHISPRATVMQQKTSRPVQVEITQPTRDTVSDWIKEAKLGHDDYLFPSRIHESPHIGTRQLLLEHTKLESTVRYLGIEVDDALEMAEQTDI